MGRQMRRMRAAHMRRCMTDSAPACSLSVERHQREEKDYQPHEPSIAPQYLCVSSAPHDVVDHRPR